MKNNSENKTKKKGNRQAKEQVSPYIFKKKKHIISVFYKTRQTTINKTKKEGGKYEKKVTKVHERKELGKSSCKTHMRKRKRREEKEKINFPPILLNTSLHNLHSLQVNLLLDG